MTPTVIRSLSSEAASAGDLAMVAICALALGGPEALEGAEPGTEFAELLLSGMTQERAVEICEEVIG